MTEGVEDSCVGLVASPTTTTTTEAPSTIPAEAPQETEVEGEEEEEAAAGAKEDEIGDGDGEHDVDSVEGEGGEDGDGDERGALGLAMLAGSCCICLEAEQVRGCLHSEKICILPIIACLLSLALCTAGLKWVFVDKIFEYEPPNTHLDPKRIGQDPIIISADPTLGLPLSSSARPPNSTSSPPNANSTTSGRPEVFVEGRSTEGPFDPPSPRVTPYSPTSTVVLRTTQTVKPDTPTTPRLGTNKHSTYYPHTTVESNEIPIPKLPRKYPCFAPLVTANLLACRSCGHTHEVIDFCLVVSIAGMLSRSQYWVVSIFLLNPLYLFISIQSKVLLLIKNT